MKIELNSVRGLALPSSLRGLAHRSASFGIPPVFEKIKVGLVESFRVAQVVLLWMVLLPLAGIFRLGIAILESIETPNTPRGPVGSSSPGYPFRTRPSHA